MLSIINIQISNGDTPWDAPITSDAPPPPMMPSITSEVCASWRVPCWKFEKLQIMLLGFGYLESSEKSEKQYTNTTHIGL